MKSLVFTLAFLVISPCVFAQGQGIELPKKDDILESTAEAMPLRDSTPDPSFGGKGEKIGWIKKGESVRVVGSKQYLSMFGMEVWLEVKKESDPSVHGWVFAGMSKDGGLHSFAAPAASPAADPAD